MEDNILICPMLEQDLDVVAELEQELFTDPWSKESLKDAIDLPYQYCCVAKLHDVIVGYSIMMCVADEGQILIVAVDKNNRRKGIASKLLNHLFIYGRQLALTIYTLEVRESNTPAIELYKKHGFTEVGRRKNYYKLPTESAVLMDKSI